MSEREADYMALREGAGIAQRPTDVVVVSGPDSGTFLQSLVSNDLDPLGEDSGAHALLLAPQGKLIADLRALRVSAEEWWLVCDAGFGSVLTEGLARYKIRVKVDIEDRSARSAGIALRGQQAAGVLAAGHVTLPTEQAHAHAALEDARVVRTDWPSSPGFEMVGPRESVAALAERFEALGARPCASKALDAVRVEAGVPLMGIDIDDSTIPQEAFLEVDAVSFTKGCFLGQELVCRIDTRGHVNRHLRGLTLGDVDVQRGATVSSDGRDVGSVGSVARSPRLGGVALAMLRREIEPPATVLVRDGTGAEQAAEVHTLPFG